jgi:hypothetical protein
VLVANAMDYDFWDTALCHPFKANVNRKLNNDGYFIPECLTSFTYNPRAGSTSKNKVLKQVEFKSIEMFELMDTDVYHAVLNKSYSGYKYFFNLQLLDFGGYFLTLLFIADSHFTFHNFLILYAMHVLDSRGILCFGLCIPTVLTM